MSTPRIWLDVPFNDKDQAKHLGARWNPTARRWYAPRPGIPGLDQWAARPPVPDLLPGEDRTFGTGLFVDLVPTSCWFTNVRSCVDQADWERLRRMITQRAGRRCECCHRGEDRDSRRWLEAHERWAYDEATRVQALRRLICLCTDCHTTTHFGLAEITGKADAAFVHLCAVTGMTVDQAAAHIDGAFNLWQRRSQRTWTLDLRILTSAGIRVAPPPAAQARPAIAQQQLNIHR